MNLTGWATCECAHPGPPHRSAPGLGANQNYSVEYQRAADEEEAGGEGSKNKHGYESSPSPYKGRARWSPVQKKKFLQMLCYGV